MSNLFIIPFRRAFAPNGSTIPGAKLYFYQTNTLIEAPVWSDAAMTLPLAIPVISDGAGKFVDIYMDPAITYRVILKDQNNNTLDDTDPYLVIFPDDTLDAMEDIAEEVQASVVESQDARDLARLYAISDTNAPIPGAVSTTDRGSKFWADTGAAAVADYGNAFAECENQIIALQIIVATYHPFPAS